MGVSTQSVRSTDVLIDQWDVTSDLRAPSLDDRTGRRVIEFKRGGRDAGCARKEFGESRRCHMQVLHRRRTAYHMILLHA